MDGGAAMMMTRQMRAAAERGERSSGSLSQRSSGQLVRSPSAAASIPRNGDVSFSASCVYGDEETLCTAPLSHARHNRI